MSTISRGVLVLQHQECAYMAQRKRELKYPIKLKQLGKRIRLIRREQGVSQENLATDAGIERSYMGAIERGERNPSYDKLVSIAKALKISVSDLTD